MISRVIGIQSLYLNNFQRFSQNFKQLPSFTRYNLLPSIQNFLKDKKYDTPSPIQQLTINTFLMDKKKFDMSEAFFIGGPTGCGKTLAYILPIMQKLKEEELKEKNFQLVQGCPRIIIMAPSRELQEQIYSVSKEISHYIKLKIEKVNVAQKWVKSIRNISDGMDILITNFNKLERLQKERKINLSLVQMIVFDEADVFIETGQSKNIINLIQSTQANSEYNNLKYIFVSATLTKKLMIFMKTFFEHKLQYLLTSDTHYNLANLEHTFLPIGDQNRLELLDMELKDQFRIKKDSYFIVFCNTVACTRAVDFFLNKAGYKTISLQGEMPSKMRIENFKKFQEKQFNILVTSDLAARGLDFTFLDGVINFDFPKNINDYIHRAGRAGRIGSPGLIINLYQNKHLPIVKRIQNSYDNNLQIDLEDSSYSFKNKEDKLVKYDNLESSIPDEYRKKFKEIQSEFKNHIPNQKKENKERMKMKPNFKKQQQKEISEVKSRGQKNQVLEKRNQETQLINRFQQIKQKINN